MLKCPHCGEPVRRGQERCFACGQKAGTRAYRAGQQANPLVLIAAGVVVVAALVGLVLVRANAAKKRAAQVTEEELLRVQDSVRLANRDWHDAEKIADKDAEVRSIRMDLDLVESRFQSVRARVAAQPNPQQESIVSQVKVELGRLRQSAVVLASTPDARKRAVRDSIQAGKRRVEDLTLELGRIR